MEHRDQVRKIDELDRRVLAVLQRDGRVSTTDLANAVGLSRPAATARIRRLEDEGTIRGYTALVDPEAVGLDLLCLVGIAMQLHSQENIARARAAIAEMPEVLECWHVTGDFDYVLKVVARDLPALARFLMDTLMRLPGVAGVRSSVCMEEIKCTSALPLGLQA